MLFILKKYFFGGTTLYLFHGKVKWGGVNGELFLVSNFKASYFDELFLCKLYDLKSWIWFSSVSTIIQYMTIGAQMNLEWIHNKNNSPYQWKEGD